MCRQDDSSSGPPTCAHLAESQENETSPLGLFLVSYQLCFCGSNRVGRSWLTWNPSSPVMARRPWVPKLLIHVGPADNLRGCSSLCGPGGWLCQQSPQAQPAVAPGCSCSASGLGRQRLRAGCWWQVIWMIECNLRVSSTLQSSTYLHAGGRLKAIGRGALSAFKRQMVSPPDRCLSAC